MFENHDGYKEMFNFVIDKTPVTATLNGCEDGTAVNTDVSVTVSEVDVKVELYTGKYTAIMSDKLGNTKTVNFTIVEPISQSFFHNFDNLTGFEKVVVNDVDIRLNYGDLTLNEPQLS